MPADETGAGRLLDDDVDNVLAVQVPAMAKEFLDAVIMVFRPVFELPGEPPVWQARDLGFEGPAGEGPRRLTDICLGIVAGAEAEQLQQFAAPVLVHRRAVVLVVVQPEYHRRIPGHLQQKVAVVTHAVIAENLDLLEQLIVVVDL